MAGIDPEDQEEETEANDSVVSNETSNDPLSNSLSATNIGLDGELSTWETELVAVDSINKVSIALSGEIEITGTIGGRGCYFLDQKDTNILQEQVLPAEGSDDVGSLEQSSDFLHDLVGHICSSLASEIANEHEEVIDITAAEPTGQNTLETVSGRCCHLYLIFETRDAIRWELNLLFPEKMGQLLGVSSDTFSNGEDTGSPTVSEPASGGRQTNQQQEYSDHGSSRNTAVKNTEFPELHQDKTFQSNNSLEMLMDIPLEVTVELGRTTCDVKDILSLGSGAVIELDKQAGAPVEVMVNGKLIARGEVVVVDETFAVRINEIVSLEQRIKNLK